MSGFLKKYGKIIDDLELLDENALQQVIDFIEFIGQKTRKINKPVIESTTTTIPDSIKKIIKHSEFIDPETETGYKQVPLPPMALAQKKEPVKSKSVILNDELVSVIQLTEDEKRLCKNITDSNHSWITLQKEAMHILDKSGKNVIDIGLTSDIDSGNLADTDTSMELSRDEIWRLAKQERELDEMKKLKKEKDDEMGTETINCTGPFYKPSAETCYKTCWAELSARDKSESIPRPRPVIDDAIDTLARQLENFNKEEIYLNAIKNSPLLTPQETLAAVRRLKHIEDWKRRHSSAETCYKPSSETVKG